jgi:hypothetical protein
MRSREESNLKTDALRNLADALSEDIAATPEPKILAEEKDDSAQRPPLAVAFEELLAKALARERGTVPGWSRADTPGVDAATPLRSLVREAPETFRYNPALAAELGHLIGRNANAAHVAAPGAEQAADNWDSWSKQTIPTLLGRMMPRLQTRMALSAFALLLVAVLAPALYERFAEHPAHFSSSPGSPLVQREATPDLAPLPPQPQAAPSQQATTNPANVEAIPQ